MNKFGMLLYPHPNKRYFDSIKTLAENEFSIISSALGVCNTEQVCSFETIGGVQLLVFEANLNEAIENALYQMSPCFILFEIKDNNTLLPIGRKKAFYIESDFSGILKYKGKTNEMFTDMMINIGIFSSAFANDFEMPLNILDPCCGKGTTLCSALMHGYNGYGVELSKDFYNEFDSYVKKYFEYHKYKHLQKNETVTHEKKKIGAKSIFTLSNTKEAFKSNDRRYLEIVNGSSTDTSKFFKKNFFHTIVLDLPYGIQHSGKNNSGYVNVSDLVSSSLPSWHKVLKTGGAVVMSFNSYTMDRSRLETDLSSGGFKVLQHGVYSKFLHWVEQAVMRDVIVAVKI